MNISGNHLLHLNFVGFKFDQCIEMDQEHFPDPWTNIQWRELEAQHHLLFGWGDVSIVGFALFRCVKGDDTAHLLKICLHPKLRGSGAAASFWSAILEELRAQNQVSVYLEVEQSNTQAIRFYLKQGFKQLREIPGYYSNGSAALILQLML